MKLSEDIKNYDKNNTSEEKVINAHFFSAYKRAFVLKLPIGYNAASFRTIFLGRKIKNTNACIAGNKQALKMGVAYSSQEEENVYPEKTDIPLDMIVTETEVI